MTYGPWLWPGQRPGVHDHKPQDTCPADCPGRLDENSPYQVRPGRHTAPPDLAAATTGQLIQELRIRLGHAGQYGMASLLHDAVRVMSAKDLTYRRSK